MNHTWRDFAPTAIRDLPRWLFLGALLIAPWYYGATTERSIAAVNDLLATLLAVWLVSLIVRRRIPVAPLMLWISVAVILALGWFVTCNARAIYDTEFGIFAAIKNIIPAAPSAVDAMVAHTAMLRLTLLVGIVLFVTDLARRSDWLLRIWITIGLAGGLIALLGLLQRATGAVLPYWEYQADEHSTFFATYYYHANAGAFLNLVFPLTVGLAIRAFQRRDSSVQRAVWATATLLLIAAIFTNTSRAAQFLGFVAFVALVMMLRRKVRFSAAENRVAVALTALIIGLALVVIAEASGITKGFERWRGITEDIPMNARWAAQRAAFSALADIGSTGFGPGSFSSVFPYYVEKYRLDVSEGSWDFLHEDYLQTLLEWGWVGSACFGVIFFGGMSAGMIGLKRLAQLRAASRLTRLLPLLLIALTATALHSLVDFPLQIQSLQLYAATYVGICWGSLAWLKPGHP
jgi:hypothetical protein